MDYTDVDELDSGTSSYQETDCDRFVGAINTLNATLNNIMVTMICVSVYFFVLICFGFFR